MIRRNKCGLIWDEFELFEGLPIIHATFTRHGGQSQGLLESLNVGRRVGDAPENVNANMGKIIEMLALPPIISARITHNSSVTKIDEPLPHESIPISDGLSTQKTDFGLMITHADCQAAIFYDPVQHAMSAVHCGWRGNVQNIYCETVKHMMLTYGSLPENLLVGISPSLGPQSAQFTNYRTELPESFLQFQVKPEYFDLWKVSRHQLEEAGVLPHHIELAEIDTLSCHDYFSYRRHNQCGRQATICALKK